MEYLTRLASPVGELTLASDGEALMGLDLQPGDHEIFMTFTPAGLWLGSILSLVCVALFLLSCYVEGRLQARGEKKEQLAQAAV